MKPTINQLMDFGPCSDGAAWLKKQKSIRKAWFICKHADWMVWALSKLGMFNDKTARAFACDCAEHVLHFYEDKYPNDNRPRIAIEASRRTITDQSSEALSARAAAGAAAGAAARAAAWAAAWAAAGAAAGAAAEAAENEWQANRLREIINPFKATKKRELEQKV